MLKDREKGMIARKRKNMSQLLKEEGTQLTHLQRKGEMITLREEERQLMLLWIANIPLKFLQTENILQNLSMIALQNMIDGEKITQNEREILQSHLRESIVMVTVIVIGTIATVMAIATEMAIVIASTL